MVEIGEAQLRAANVAHDRCAAIARQVRCSTGYTECAIAMPSRLRPVAADRAAAGEADEPAGLARRLLGVLRGLGDVLPPALELAHAIGLGGTAPNQRAGVIRAFGELVDRGEILSIAAPRTEGGNAARAVLLLAENRVLMSASAPRHWADALRRRLV